MSGLMPMLIVWSVITGVLVCLVIYRVILGNQEEDQVYISQGEAGLERENQEVVNRINRVDPFIRWTAIASGGLLLVIGGIWIYRGLFTTPSLD